jgi:hypothetical protein
MKPFHVGALAPACLLFVGLLDTPVVAGEKPKDPASAEHEAAIARLTQEQARLIAEIKDLRAQLAQTPTPLPAEDRLQALEARLVKLEEDLQRFGEESRQIAGAVDDIASREQKRSSVTVYGNVDFSAYRNQDSVLDARTFEMVFSGHPHDRLSFFAEVEFERAAAVGGPRGGEIDVEQAFATYSLSPLLNIRGGAFLVPFGNINIDHFAPRREVVTAPLVSYVVVPSDWTDNGVGLFGKRVLGTRYLLSYEGYVMAGLGEPVTGLGLRLARQGYGVDNNGDKAVVARVALSRADTAHVGLSGYSGKYDDLGRRRMNGWAVDGLLTLGSFKVTGEYDDFAAARAAGPDIRLRGYYVRGVYSFGRALLARTRLGRGFQEPRLAAFAQYDDVQTDGPDNGPFNGTFEHSEERRTSAGLNFRPSTQWVLKLSYEWNDSKGHALDRGDRDGFLASIGFIF